MFLKPFRVKTQNAIKGSDRKKLRGELNRLYPSIPKEQWTELVPNKEEMTIAKVQCHNGETILMYCLQKNPIFFDVDKIVYPTVYLLWKYPDLLPSFTTWPQVFPKFLGGADLMLPGICVQGEITPNALGNLPKTTTCSVKLLGNNAPMAVGYTTMSTRDMVLDAGMKGKGVIIVHCYGDQMWSFGDKSEPPVLESLLSVEAESSDAEDEEGEDAPTEEGARSGACNVLEEGESDSQGPGENGVNSEELLGATPTDESSERLPAVDGLSLEETDAREGDESEDDPRTPQEQMDELLNWSFLCALKISLKKADLPILTSNFYRNHMLPCCPKGKTLDIKKSSYKKLSKFLGAMKKRGLVTLKQQKDVESITDVDRNHTDLRGLDTSGVELAPKASAAGPDESTEAAAPVLPPVITEVYLVTTNTLPVFKPLGHSKGAPLTAAEVRNVLIDYCKTNELQDQRSKGFATLDPILSDMVLNKGEYVESLRYDELTTRCLSKMTLAHKMSFNGQPPFLKKGKLEPVNIKVVQRAGNKKATFIENLEVYGIDAQEFAHTVQVGVACSTSVTPLPGKNHGLQVMVQGNQILYVANVLQEKYRLQRKWIAGAEKAAKGKKR